MSMSDSLTFLFVHILRIHSLNAVVSALADQKKKEGHIPYRDSKLTRILQVSKEIDFLILNTVNFSL